MAFFIEAEKITTVFPQVFRLSISLTRCCCAETARGFD